jgi:hypothetical protein
MFHSTNWSLPTQDSQLLIMDHFLSIKCLKALNITPLMMNIKNCYKRENGL